MIHLCDELKYIHQKSYGRIEVLKVWSLDQQNHHHLGTYWDFPGGPVVKNLPYRAGDTGSIPGQGTKIPHAAGN